VTPEQAQIVLKHLRPLVLSRVGDHSHPITPNHRCITETELNALGYTGDMLYEHPWYDLVETDASGQRVHVMLQREMESYAHGRGWTDGERLRRAAQEKMERGG
jgi:hypothetical protein